MMPPQDKVCPKCGGGIPFGTECPTCGPRRSNTTMVVVSALLLTCLGIPAGLVGACFLMIASSPGGSSTSGNYVLIGFLGLAIPLLFTVLLIRSVIKK